MTPNGPTTWVTRLAASYLDVYGPSESWGVFIRAFVANQEPLHMCEMELRQ